MTVSVCIPCLNGAAHLESAVRSALAQTHRDIEVVICENASTDDSPAIARRLAAADPRIRVHENPSTLPMAANWNTAPSRSRPARTTCCSAPTTCIEPTFAERCAAVFERRPELGHVWTERTDIDESGRVVREERYFAADCLLPAPVEGRINLVGGHSVPSQVLVRRACWEAIGGYDERYDFCHDRLFATRVGLEWDTAYLSDALCSYRVHEATASSRFAGDKLGVMEQYRMKLDLLRARPDLAPLRDLVCARLARLCESYSARFAASGDARLATEYDHLGRSFHPPGTPLDEALQQAVLGRADGIPIGARGL